MSTPTDKIPEDIMKLIGEWTGEHMNREFSAAMNDLKIPRSMEWIRVHEAYQEAAIRVYQHISNQSPTPIEAVEAKTEEKERPAPCRVRITGCSYEQGWYKNKGNYIAIKPTAPSPQ